MRIVESSNMTKTLALKAFVKRFGLASMRRREVPSVHSNSKSGWMGRLPPSVSAAFRFCGRERRQHLFLPRTERTVRVGGDCGAGLAP